MPFSHLTVLELSAVLAGPSVGQFFAELGARVIKVENRNTGGDITRAWKLPGEPAEAPDSAYYWSVNWGKERVLLDLRREEDRARVEAWVKESDVLISNFRPASARRLGMDPPRLRALNPRLIYAQLYGFGPEDGRPAFDVVLQAEAGFLYMCGEPNRRPVKMPVALIDLLAGHQLKEGILLALLQREKTGRGCLVETSLLESAVASLANQASNYLMTGRIPQRMGSTHPNIAPYGDLFTCRGGEPMVLAVGTEAQFAALCELLQRPDLLQDERFALNSARLNHREELAEALQAVFATRSREEWMQDFRQKSIPAGSIRNMKEVFEQPAAREMVWEEPLPDGRMARGVQTVAFRLK